MKRLEAYRILSKMWNDVTPEQEEAINIAQDAIEFVDLMPDDMVAVVRCKDCKHMAVEPIGRYCHVWGDFNGAGDDGFCNYGEKKDGED